MGDCVIIMRVLPVLLLLQAVVNDARSQQHGCSALHVAFEWLCSHHASTRWCSSARTALQACSPSKRSTCATVSKCFDVTESGGNVTMNFETIPNMYTDLQRLQFLSMFLNFQPASHVMRNRTCVVVGNGPNEGGKGALIDGHDMVIRINDAPAGGRFADAVGTKTSVRLLLNEYLTWERVNSVKNRYTQGEQLLFYLQHYSPDKREEGQLLYLYLLLLHSGRGSATEDLNAAFKGQNPNSASGHELVQAYLARKHWQTINMLTQGGRNSKFRSHRIGILSWEMQMQLNRILNVNRRGLNGIPNSPSTGILAISYAMHVCRSVAITGYETTLRGGGAYERYYTDGGLGGPDGVSAYYGQLLEDNPGLDLLYFHGRAHNVVQESRYLKSLLRQGKISKL